VTQHEKRAEDSWWKNAVGYQIYPRSFKDSNADGIGDIDGIRQKLPYLKDLGVDFLWLNPIYKSPNVDNGYDISDYEDIQEEFGTLDEFKEFLKEAHGYGIKVIMDLVVNHTSDQHPWFLESKQSKDNPYRDYYLWEDATPERLPNDWQSFFGGSTWTYDETTKQVYFHVFAKEQPDLNWKNAKMREEIYDMIRWWLDFGIDGFRLDAISHIQKEPWDFKIKDNPWAPFMNVSGIETYMEELRAIFKEYNIMTVGEASGVTSRKAAFWTGEDDGYIDMIFELEHNHRMGLPGEEVGDPLGFKKTIARWQKDLSNQGWNALYIENHDNPRSVSVWGDNSPKSSKALATAYMLLRGTPFIYQGQEIGMTNYPFSSIEEVDAKDSHSQYNGLLEEGKSVEEALKITTHWTRDHSRTPMQWDDSEGSGFTEGTPWLAINPNKAEINVKSEEQEKLSTLNYYKQLIHLRKTTSVLINGTFELLLSKHPQVFAYLRKDEEAEVFVLVNLSKDAVQIDLPTRVSSEKWQEVLTNDHTKKVEKRMSLSGFEAHVYMKGAK
jgi:alpha-glucosidase